MRLTSRCSFPVCALPSRDIGLSLAKHALLLDTETLLSIRPSLGILVERDQATRLFKVLWHLPPQPTVDPTIDGLKFQQEAIVAVGRGNNHKLRVRNVSGNLLLLRRGEQSVGFDTNDQSRRK